MLKPTFRNVLLFIAIKYLVFYGFLMVKNADYKLLEIKNITKGHTLTYFIFVMLPLPLISMLLFSGPIYYALRLKSILLTFILFVAILLGEYFLYVYFTPNRHPDSNGIYNAIIGVIVFSVMFFRYVGLKFTNTVKEE